MVAIIRQNQIQKWITNKNNKNSDKKSQPTGARQVKLACAPL